MQAIVCVCVCVHVLLREVSVLFGTECSNLFTPLYMYLAAAGPCIRHACSRR